MTISKKDPLIQWRTGPQAGTWYLAKTHANRERVARFQLRNQGYDCYLPMRQAKTLDKRMVAAKPFIPGYIFVFVRADQEVWPVFSTIGVASVICSGATPQPVPGDIVEAIRGREVEGLVKVEPKRCDAQSGEKVRLRDLPLEAVFEERVDANRGVILLSLLGRQHRVPVHLAAIEKPS